jgi:proteasome lid subunit RPN8/RPN11
MKWNNVKPDIHSRPINESTSGWSALDIANFISQSVDSPLVVLPESIRTKISKHLESQNVELGGLLVGSVISIGDLTEGITAIVIKDSIASNDFESTSVSLSMSPSVWQTANKLSDAKTFVVGWYHSHPNLGAFFSGVDRKTQKDFFNSEYSLGLVIDPIRNEEKWFLGAESIEVELNKIRSELNGLALV